MREISVEYWLNQEADGAGFLYPKRVRMSCEHCSAWAVVDLRNAATNVNAAVRSADGNCPSCGVSIQFILLYPMEAAQGGHRKPIVFFATGLSESHLSFAKLSDAVGPRVSEAAMNATNAFNAGRYAEAANQMRRALEGALKKALEGTSVEVVGRRQSLHELIDSAAQQVELAAPLKRLAQLAKDAGNLGSHFDDNGEPDPELIRQQILATQNIISFLFELPATIDAMETLLGKTPKPLAQPSNP